MCIYVNEDEYYWVDFFYSLLQIDKMQFDKVLEYIQYGKRDGAKLLLGGNSWGDKGFYIEPTIFADVQVFFSLT